jgi:hypothetical protein
VTERRLQREHFRPASHQSQQVHAERRLEGCHLVELVQDHFLGGVPAQLDDDAHALAVRLIAQVGDAVDLSVPYQIGDALQEQRLVHHVRDLGHHDALAAPALLEARLGAYGDVPAARGVGLTDAFAPADRGPCGKVGARQLLHELFQTAVRVPRLDLDGIHQLAQVVRRDGGRHSHGDARRSVGQEIGEAGWEHHRLVDVAIEVGHEVDGLAVDVLEHRLRQRMETGLGVAVGGCGVAVDGAEVSLSVHQRVTQRKVLGHAHQGVVDGLVAMGMVVLEHLAHDAGGLGIAPRGEQALLVHGVQDATVDGLQAVAHVRQRPADDDGHRVVEKRGADLVLDGDGGVVPTARRAPFRLSGRRLRGNGRGGCLGCLFSHGS